MTWNPSSPVTGAPQTGFTSPTYTIVSDQAPDANGRQYAVTVAGGTQAGVTIHSVSSPFTSTLVKPKVFKTLGKPNPTTGLVTSVPRNVWKHIVRKGVTPLSGQPITTMLITMNVEVPAGADTADPANVRAALSLAAGLLWAQASGLGDSVTSGVF